MTTVTLTRTRRLRTHDEPAPASVPLLWTIDDVCRFLGISEPQVRLFRNVHGLPTIHVPGSQWVRFDPASVAAWARSYETVSLDTEAAVA